jgi:hypothetical protein
MSYISGARWAAPKSAAMSKRGTQMLELRDWERLKEIYPRAVSTTGEFVQVVRQVEATT